MSLENGEGIVPLYLSGIWPDQPENLANLKIRVEVNLKGPLSFAEWQFLMNHLEKVGSEVVLLLMGDPTSEVFETPPPVEVIYGNM